MALWFTTRYSTRSRMTVPLWITYQIRPPLGHVHLRCDVGLEEGEYQNCLRGHSTGVRFYSSPVFCCMIVYQKLMSVEI